MAEPAPLRRLQRFVQAVIVHPGGVRRAAALAARKELGCPVTDALKPSRTLSAVERIGIYQGMYLLRMRDALAADYPGLKHALGNEGFRELVEAYVRRHPSTSYTLNRLGDHLPSYLARTRRGPRGRFLADLARLELAVTEVFDAVAPEPVRKLRRAPVGASTTFRPSPTLRFLSFAYPVGIYLDAVKDDRSPRIPRASPTRVALWRSGATVRRLDLGPGAEALLRRLAAGRPLGATLLTLNSRARRELSERVLVRLFRTAVSGEMLLPC